MFFQCWASVKDSGPTLKQLCVNTPCLLDSQVVPYQRPSGQVTRQLNSGSMLVHYRWLGPSTIQHWTVLSVGGGVSTKYNQTPIRCLLNVGPLSCLDKERFLDLETIVLGDFNTDVFRPSTTLYKSLNHLMYLCNWFQLINEPTRVTPVTESALDLEVFTVAWVTIF